jgi:hypothetical protein
MFQLLEMHRDSVEAGRTPTLWRLGRWTRQTLMLELEPHWVSSSADSPQSDCLLGAHIEWVEDPSTIELLSTPNY